MQKMYGRDQVRVSVCSVAIHILYTKDVRLMKLTDWREVLQNLQ